MTISRPFSGVLNQQVAPSDISTTSLQGFWRMNEGTGTAVVSETATHQGTTVNTPTWVTGKSGTGLDFNGTTQYVNITKTAALNSTGNAVSLMAWIHPDSTTGARRIVCLPTNESSGNEKYALFIADGVIDFWIWASTETHVSATFTTTGSWSHVAGVYNGTDLRVYINGTSSATPVSLSGNMQNSTNGDLQIGRFGPTWGQYFDGIIDDVRVYTRAVSAAEVDQVYDLG